MRTVIDIGANKTSLFFKRRVSVCIASPGLGRIVVIVAPFCEVVGEFKSGCVCGCILKINDNELSMGIFGK